MMYEPRLDWLVPVNDFRAKLQAAVLDQSTAWSKLLALANTQLDFIRTSAVDAALRGLTVEAVPAEAQGQAVRLAVLGSSTTTHLLPALRVAGLRRGLQVVTYESAYEQYFQELLDEGSGLHQFKPNAVLFAFDARHLTRAFQASFGAEQASADLGAAKDQIVRCWETACARFGCQIIQQTVINVFQPLMGSNEQRLYGSRRRAINLLNADLRTMADEHSVDLLAIDDRTSVDGLPAWHDHSLWHRSKQDVSLAASPMYGELALRLVAARRGLSKKCLVLDLDNTLWGGVIGDDGLHGIVLGQGTPLGEGYVALQSYARDLTKRGVILAVCSKNDPANALEPFEKHPEMVLRQSDIASFQASWGDKVTALRAIAEELSIGIDSLVFLDDNPFERSLVRQELPMVAVPEVRDDPVHMLTVLANAGYFEGVALTEEDRLRHEQYQKNAERTALRQSSTDLESYLATLEMKLIVRKFDEIGLQRITQLINKTNQFNLTTKRYSTDDVMAVMNDDCAFGLQLRLLDRFGDNGIISIIIGRFLDDDELEIDTWLMSCRVLGRQVEAATLDIVVQEAKDIDATRIKGKYIRSAKNNMVSSHYDRLGFNLQYENNLEGIKIYTLDLVSYKPLPNQITIVRE